VIASSAVVQFRSDSDATIAGRLAVAGTAPTIRFESDVRCAALAEWRSIHTAREEGDVEDASLLYISVGTGLSSAFVMSSGEVLSGARGSAISFGEWPAPLSSLPTPEPAANLEGFASGRGIEQRYFAITGRKSTTPRICERAGVDHVATTVLAEAGTAIGAGIRSLFAVLDPATIVVGGGLGSADTVVWAAIQDAVATPMAGRRLPPLRQAALGSRSGEFGAAYVAMAEFSNRG
jgi:glucokinase